MSLLNLENFSYFHLPLCIYNMQTLTSVQLVHTTVDTFVPTLMAPSLVPVMMDMNFNQMDIHVNVEAHSLQPVVVSRHLDGPVVTHKRTSSVCGLLI